MLSLPKIDRKMYKEWFEGPSRQIFFALVANRGFCVHMVPIGVMSMASVCPFGVEIARFAQ